MSTSDRLGLKPRYSTLAARPGSNIALIAIVITYCSLTSSGCYNTSQLARQEIASAIASPSPIASAAPELTTRSTQEPSHNDQELQAPSDLRPGLLEVLTGPPIEAGGTVLVFQVSTLTGYFQLGLRANLAPKSVKYVVSLIDAQAFKGQTISLKEKDFPTFSAAKKNIVTSRPLQEKNRIKPAAGLIYFDRHSKFGLTLTDKAKVPPSWVCIGQIKIDGSTLDTWAKKPPAPPKITSISSNFAM